MAELTREEFLVHMDLVRSDLGEVKEHVLKQNSRIGAAETKLAVLEDRGTRDTGARIGAGLTALVSGLGAIWAYLKG